MPVIRCLNCEGDVLLSDFLVMHNRKVIGAVCAKCLDGVKKPRITCTRKRAGDELEAEQFACVETFRR